MVIRLFSILFSLFGFFCEILVELFNELVGVNTVNHAGFFDGFHTGYGAVDAVHAGFEENVCGIFVKINDIADDGVKSNFHFIVLRYGSRPRRFLS